MNIEAQDAFVGIDVAFAKRNPPLFRTLKQR